MRILIIIKLSLFLSSWIYAQNSLQLGDPAPMIAPDGWADNPHYDFKDFEGKAVVLDFWFTHCAPCIYTLPHLNDLSQAYKHEDVAFISITFENEAVVSEFLTKKQMLANVGTDTAFQLINKYGVLGYPTTFLIDAKGILRWQGSPSQVNHEMIDLLLDKSYHPEVKAEEGAQPINASHELPIKEIYLIEVQESAHMGAASGFQINKDEISLTNKSLQEVFAILLNTSESRIQMQDAKQYDVRFKIPQEITNDNDSKAVAFRSLLKKLNMKSEWKKKEVKGYELALIKTLLQR